jgi:uncharacterized protein (UPF0179 family)
MPRSKRENQIRHARKRAHQRFGLNATHIQQIEEDIRNQKCQLLERQSNIRTAWYVEIEELEIVAVYDSRRNVVVTLIPYEWWKAGHAGTSTSVRERTPIVQFLSTP